jgi:hypothetical protein
VLSHVSEEGDTSAIDVASLSTLTHVATYIRGKEVALGDSYSSQAAYIEILAMWARVVYPFDFLQRRLTGGPFYLFCLLRL